MRFLFSFLIAIPFIFSNAQAQYKHQNGSTIIQIGYANMVPKGVDVSLDGVALNLSYEYLNLKKILAYGFSVSYLEGTGSETTANYKYHTWPITFMAKGFLGGEKFRGYIRGQIGVQSTTAQRETSLLQSKVWSTGLTAGGGLGFNYVLSERIFLNLEYNANWLDSNIYDSQLIHAITLGIGIQER